MGIFNARSQEIPRSFGNFLERHGLEPSDNETVYLAGNMFGAGSDKTVSAISFSTSVAAA